VGRVLKVWGQRLLWTSLGLWRERTTELRRLRIICFSVCSRHHQALLSLSFRSWVYFFQERAREYRQRSSVQILMERRNYFLLFQKFAKWLHFCRFISRLRSVAMIVCSRYGHNLLLRVVWSWSWGVRYRQLGVDKLSVRIRRDALAVAFKAMKSAVCSSAPPLAHRLRRRQIMSRCFDAWAACAALASSISQLGHRHYTFPVFISWTNAVFIENQRRMMPTRSAFSRWRSVVHRLTLLKSLCSALKRHVLCRSIHAAFDKWRRWMVCARAHGALLRFVMVHWHRIVVLKLLLNQVSRSLEARKLLGLLKAWRSVVDAAHRAGAVKLQAYAAAANRRSAMQSNSASPGQQPLTLSPDSPRSIKIPWRL
jgi:hypothetical protein